MLQSEGQVVTNPAVRYGAWLLFSGFLLWFVIFSSFSVGWLHLAKSIGPRVLGVKAGFTGAHAVSVSMLLALMNLRYWIFSNSTLTPIHAHYSQVSDQDSASNLLMLCSSYIVQVLLLATDVLLDTSSPGLCVQFSTDTAYKSTFQSDTKSLQVPCPGGIAAFSKLKLSSHSVFFIIKFYLQFTFFARCFSMGLMDYCCRRGVQHELQSLGFAEMTWRILDVFPENPWIDWRIFGDYVVVLHVWVPWANPSNHRCESIVTGVKWCWFCSQWSRLNPTGYIQIWSIDFIDRSV